MITYKINNYKKNLVDWCAIFDVNYSTVWSRLKSGETDPAILFASRKHKSDAIQAKIDKHYKPREQKDEVQSAPTQENINSVYKTDEVHIAPTQAELLPVQYDVFAQSTRDAILLVDVLGEELLSELRRECRYHMGIPLTQAVHEAVKTWTESARIKRSQDRAKKLDATTEPDKKWSLW